MAATKTAKTLLTSQSLAAGASVNVTEWNLSTAYAGSRLFVKLSLPGSAPTTVPFIKFYSGEATGVKRLIYQVSGSVTAGDYPMDIPCVFEQGDMFGNVTVTNGSTNAITVEAYGQEATTI